MYTSAVVAARECRSTPCTSFTVPFFWASVAIVLVVRLPRVFPQGRILPLSLAWSYFPHSWSVQCGSMKTPMQVFESDIDFKKAIAKHFTYGSGPLTDAAVRRVVRYCSGAQAVSNFKPEIGRAHV